MAEYMFPNVAYRATVYRTGGSTNSEVQLSFLLFTQEKRQFAKKKDFAMVYFYQIRLIFATSHICNVVPISFRQKTYCYNYSIKVQEMTE